MRTNTLQSILKSVILATFFTFVTTFSFAQFKMSANIQANHLWRGGEVADGIVVTYDAAIKPLGDNFSVGVWGGVNAPGTYKEFNYFAKYVNGGFKASLTDTYNFSDYATYNNEEFFNYDPTTTGRFLDAALSYRFGENFPIKLSLSTVLFGRDRNSENTANRYSTFGSVAYPIYNKDSWRVDMVLGAAFALKPMGESENFYGKNAGIVEISMIVSHDLVICNYTIPLTLNAMWNPQSDQAHLQLLAQIFSF